MKLVTPLLAITLLGASSSAMAGTLYASIFRPDGGKVIENSTKGQDGKEFDWSTQIQWVFPEPNKANYPAYQTKCALGPITAMPLDEVSIAAAIESSVPGWKLMRDELNAIKDDPEITDKAEPLEKVIKKYKDKNIKATKKWIDKANVRYRFFFSSDKNAYEKCKKDDSWDLWDKAPRDKKEVILVDAGAAKGIVEAECIEKNTAGEEIPACGTPNEAKCTACTINASVLPSTMAAIAMVAIAGLFFM